MTSDVSNMAAGRVRKIAITKGQSQKVQKCIDIFDQAEDGDMKVGDSIRVVGTPSGLEGETKSLLELCVGRVFPILEIAPAPEIDGEVLELHLAELVGEPDPMHSIWIEKEFVTMAAPTND